jgi:hypothetical protein
VIVSCVRFGLVDWFAFCLFYETRWVVPRLFRGPLGMSPTVAPEHLRGIRWDPVDAGAG